MSDIAECTDAWRAARDAEQAAAAQMQYAVRSELEARTMTENEIKATYVAIAETMGMTVREVKRVEVWGRPHRTLLGWIIQSGR